MTSITKAKINLLITAHFLSLTTDIAVNNITTTVKSSQKLKSINDASKGYKSKENEPDLPSVTAKCEQRNADVCEDKVFHEKVDHFTQLKHACHMASSC